MRQGQLECFGAQRASVARTSAPQVVSEQFHLTVGKLTPSLVQWVDISTILRDGS